MPLLILTVLLALVASAVPVAAVLGILSLTLDELFARGRRSLMLGDFTWEQSIEYILVAIPMFILLGEIILRAGIAYRMYNAVIQWLSWLPGGLMHANIGSSAIFAASSGSSVATAATVGTVAYPEIKKRNYQEKLFLGSLAAGGTLGILIPPSINLIVYGLLTDSSVPERYLAGIFPGVILALQAPVERGAVQAIVPCSVSVGPSCRGLRRGWRLRAARGVRSPPCYRLIQWWVTAALINRTLSRSESIFAGHQMPSVRVLASRSLSCPCMRSC